MKLRSTREVWSGMMFIVAGIVFATGATNYRFGSSAQPGPGYFPFGLGIILAILGAVVLFKALMMEARGGAPIGAWAWKPFVTTLGAVALFGVLLPSMGMVVALPVLIVVSTLAGDEFHLGEALASSAILTLGCWLVFIKGLGLTIPLWPWFVG